MKMRAIYSRSGFTMIEMLVAIAIFALLSLMSYQILDNVYRIDSVSQLHSTQLREYQQAMQLIQLDVVQMIPRTVRNEKGIEEAALLAGRGVLNSSSEGMRFVRAGLANPQMQLSRSHLLRVGYRIYEGQLERMTWHAVDVSSRTKPQAQLLLPEVSSMTLRFYDGKKWLPQWNVKEALPVALGMTLDTKHFGEIERIWLLHPKLSTDAITPELKEG